MLPVIVEAHAIHFFMRLARLRSSIPHNKTVLERRKFKVVPYELYPPTT